jgi:two-component system cell cycle response regulator DivK
VNHTNHFFGGWCFLIVDDSVDTLNMLQVVLERYGIHVSRALDGAQALQRAVETQPDMIITDLAMPTMDGWELIAQLKSNPRTQTIPVVALTAHALLDDRQRAIAAGADGFVIKPVTPGAFIKELMSLIEGMPHLNRERTA